MALTWAYAIVTWMLVDVAKVITQRIFRSQAKIKEECKQDETTPPAWVRAIDMPGTLAERAADGMEAGIQVSHCLPDSCAEPPDSYMITADRAGTLHNWHMPDWSKLRFVAIHLLND